MEFMLKFINRFEKALKQVFEKLSELKILTTMKKIRELNGL